MRERTQGSSGKQSVRHSGSATIGTLKGRNLRVQSQWHSGCPPVVRPHWGSFSRVCLTAGDDGGGGGPLRRLRLRAAVKIAVKRVRGLGRLESLLLLICLSSSSSRDSWTTLYTLLLLLISLLSLLLQLLQKAITPGLVGVLSLLINQIG